MYDALHMVALKKCNDEKHSYEIVDGIEKQMSKMRKKKQLNMRKNQSQSRQSGMKISQ